MSAESAVESMKLTEDMSMTRDVTPGRSTSSVSPSRRTRFGGQVEFSGHGDRADGPRPVDPVSPQRRLRHGYLRTVWSRSPAHRIPGGERTQAEHAGRGR